MRIDGPPVLLEPNAAQAIAVTLHELATNAAKYRCVVRGQGPGRPEMVARGGRTADPALDGDGRSAGADTDAPRLWQAGHRTNDRTTEGHKRILTGAWKGSFARSRSGREIMARRVCRSPRSCALSGRRRLLPHRQAED